MSDRGDVVTRLLAFVHALLPEDWFGGAGESFRKMAEAISQFAEKHQARPKDLADEALHGKANKDLAAAVKDFTEAESKAVETELQKRVAPAEVRKSQAEARLAELQVLHSEVDLVRKMKDLGIVFRCDERGNLTVLPAAENLNYELLEQKFRLPGDVHPNPVPDTVPEELRVPPAHDVRHEVAQWPTVKTGETADELDRRIEEVKVLLQEGRMRCPHCKRSRNIRVLNYCRKFACNECGRSFD